MTSARNSQILLTILLTILILSLCSPTQAKYSGGTGEPNDPYQIATAEDLMLLGESPDDYDKHFILTADIDLDPNLPGRKVFDKAVIAPATTVITGGRSGGIGVRIDVTPFTGVFDGNGHIISHLTISGDIYLGLFGQLGSKAEISNLGLEVTDINGTDEYIGVLAGMNDGTITKCYSTGLVTGSYDVGGLVGLNTSSISQSYSACTVNGRANTGGLVGANNDTGYLNTSYSTGSVIGNKIVGGIMGYNNGSITASYSNSKVSGEELIGGLVGLNEDSITASYSASTVTGGRSVGGFAGFNGRNIIMSYSIGIVSGETKVGGFVGGESTSHATACFWDVQTSGQNTSTSGTGLTTIEMKDMNTYLNAGWDFADEISNGTCDYWQMSIGDYPQLFYNPGNNPVMPEGLGTVEEPYLIRNARDLGTVWFKPMAYYRLEASVDMSGITWSMAVIPSFWRTFDGNGYVVSNLHIQGSGYLGLFGELNPEAMVSNLGLEAVDVNGTGEYISGLVGFNMGNIIKSYSNGSVSGSKTVGGIVGCNYGSISATYSNGVVIGNESVGGLVGYNSCSIDTSYSTCTTSGKRAVGGLVGYNNGSITQSYSIGMVSGNANIGGLVGDKRLGRTTNSIWDKQSSGLAMSTGGTGLNTPEMMDPYVLGLNGFANDPNWVLNHGLDYPRLAWEDTPGQIIPEPEIYWLEGNGTTEDPYRINTADQLILLGKASILLDKCFVLDANIDLDSNLLDGRVFESAIIPQFTGVFDGNDHIISNLLISGESYLGLFGQLENRAEVKNMGVVDVNITGLGCNIGGLVGYIYDDGCITQSYCTGTVSGDDHVGGLVGSNNGSIISSYTTSSTSGETRVGGLVGVNSKKITMSYSNGTINGNWMAGGLVGENRGNITKSYNTGMVTGNQRIGGLVGHNYEDGHITMSSNVGNVDGDAFVGGLVGFNFPEAYITSSYNTGTVSGNGCVGGLVGHNYDDGYITTSYSTGNVCGGRWPEKTLGGLVGFNEGNIIMSYSTGTVSADRWSEYFGGLVGGNRGDSSVTSSFWDVQTSGYTNMCGLQVEDATDCDDSFGKTTSEMQNADTFLEAGWDFVDETANGTDDIWWLDEGNDYPHLWWEFIE